MTARSDTSCSAASHRTVRLHCKSLAMQIRPDALTQLFAQRPLPAILGGNEADCQANRFGVWAAEPREVFECSADEQRPLERLQQEVSRYALDAPGATDLPAGMFCGGWIGYFSYDLGRFIEKTPAVAVDDLHLPLIRLCFYDRAVCYDRLEQRWWLVALEMEEDVQLPRAKLDGLLHLLREAQNAIVPAVGEGDLGAVDVSRTGCNMSRGAYFDALKRIRQYICDGDVYQINFSQRFECAYDRSPIALYHWQNRYNASPYAAYIDAGRFSIISASPEMFLTVRDGRVSTQPIKGTRRRLVWHPEAAVLNEANFLELVRSEKEQAELNMIIDLERNDLARICVPGSRFVSQPRTIETYPTVFHAVATVEGRLRPACSFTDILRAVFPGGSITGAPKIRAMEIIDELEPTRRGVYTGSIGYIGLDGSVCLNIAIRTVIIAGGTAYAQTGGGIVADSEPEAEWEETITKARALLAGIAAVQQS
ncbi:MAG: anthranilate synthase component I family protein [Phycisphaerae bacterium]|nr:anthranilate synthase component I family protein [Phycisphaerae bacterium]